jgi:chaperonin GroES
MAFKLQPLNDRLILSQDANDEKTPGGILIPQSVVDRDPPKMGTVVAVGPGAYKPDGSRREMPFKKGDRVVFTGYGPPVSDGERDYIVIEESQVAAVIHD